MAITIEHLNKVHSENHPTGFLTVVGPCSTDSEVLAAETVDEAHKRGVVAVRLNPFKPRTNLRKNGERVYQGSREEGLAWFDLAWDRGITPAAEIMTPRQAEAVKRAMGHDPDRNVVLWTGARTNVTEIVEEMADVFRGDDRVIWGVKNPLAPDLDLWVGLADAAQEGGIPRDRIFMIHRGFVERANIRNKIERGTPDFGLAMQIKQETGLPMLFDPSHLTTDPQRMISHTRDALVYASQDGSCFDGLLMEVHPRPEESLTDPGITWDQFDALRIPGIGSPLVLTDTQTPHRIRPITQRLVVAYGAAN